MSLFSSSPARLAQARSKELRALIADAQKRKVAIGHFNISNIEGFWAVVRAAEAVSKQIGGPVPVIIGVSEGERDFMGVSQVRALVDSVRAAGQPVFLNADHTYSFEKVKEVVDAGYDSVIYDGTEQSFDDNVAATKKCVSYARSKNPAILIEAEIGFIGKSSKVLDAIPEGVQISEEFLTKPEEAKKFLEATGVDMLAPAVGNIHGMLSGGKDPALNIKRIGEITAALQKGDMRVPLVLHGGSGNSAEDFMAAIDAGVAIIHVNTEIRVAFRDALVAQVAKDPGQVAPYKIMKPTVDAMQKVVEEKLRIFNKIR